MKVGKILGFLLKMAVLTAGLFAALILFVMLLMKFEKNDVAPYSIWVLIVDKELRKMPTPEGSRLHSYGTQAYDGRIRGYDVARYTWQSDPTDFEVWLSYWKTLGYLQLERNLNHCGGLHAQLIKADLSTRIEICHDPDTKTTWIEKTP